MSTLIVREMTKHDMDRSPGVYYISLVHLDGNEEIIKSDLTATESLDFFKKNSGDQI